MPSNQYARMVDINADADRSDNCALSRSTNTSPKMPAEDDSQSVSFEDTDVARMNSFLSRRFDYSWQLFSGRRSADIGLERFPTAPQDEMDTANAHASSQERLLSRPMPVEDEQQRGQLQISTSVRKPTPPQQKTKSWFRLFQSRRLLRLFRMLVAAGFLAAEFRLANSVGLAGLASQSYKRLEAIFAATWATPAVVSKQKLPQKNMTTYLGRYICLHVFLSAL